MAEVTGYTAEAMDVIRDETVVDGDINGSGHLILTTRGGTPIDAGLVKGDTGEQGPPGTDPSIIVCTSVTRPTVDLFEGLMIYETDTDRFYFYDGSGWVYRGGFFICTSVTRPGSPFEGLVIYETDTNRINIYTGSVWENIWFGWKPKGFSSAGVTSGTFVVSTTSGQDWQPAAPFDVSFVKRGEAGQSYIYVRTIWSAYGAATGTNWWATMAGVKVGATTYWGQRFHQVNIGDCHFEFNDAIAISGIPAGSVTMRARIKKNTGSQNVTCDVGDFFIIEYEEVPIV